MVGGVEHLTASSEYFLIPSVIINLIFLYQTNVSIYTVSFLIFDILYKKKDGLQLQNFVIEETVDL